MKKFIMMYSGNWNDEIDVDGFVIMNKSQSTYLKRFLKNFDSPISISLGFGDDVDYDNGRDLMDEISFQEITNEEGDVIRKIFGNSNDFGDNLILSIKDNADRNGKNFIFDRKTEETCEQI